MITVVGLLGLVLMLVHAPQGEPSARVIVRVPERPDPASRYLFYLHGRIVEDQGVNAVSPEYGRYEYSTILQRFADHGFVVVSEARAPNTDPETYAETVAKQIRHLVDSGVSASHIGVIGASKGAVIAMLVSTQVATPVRYVLMANCNDFVFQTFSLSLHGHVLSIYEASDELGRTCEPLFERSTELGERREIQLSTGLRHGFLFRPLEAWMEPAVAWASSR